jgi:hypothetical protein
MLDSAYTRSGLFGAAAHPDNARCGHGHLHSIKRAARRSSAGRQAGIRGPAARQAPDLLNCPRSGFRLAPCRQAFPITPGRDFRDPEKAPLQPCQSRCSSAGRQDLAYGERDRSPDGPAGRAEQGRGRARRLNRGATARRNRGAGSGHKNYSCTMSMGPSFSIVTPNIRRACERSAILPQISEAAERRFSCHRFCIYGTAPLTALRITPPYGGGSKLRKWVLRSSCAVRAQFSNSPVI